MFQLFLLGSLGYFMGRSARGCAGEVRDIRRVDDHTLSDIGLNRYDLLVAPEARDR